MSSWWTLTASPLTGSVSWLLGSASSSPTSVVGHKQVSSPQTGRPTLDGNDTDTDGWQIVVTHDAHHQSSTFDMDDNAGPVILSESQFTQMPALQPIPGMSPDEDEDEVDGVTFPLDEDELDAAERIHIKMITAANMFTTISDHCTAPSTPRVAPSVSPNEPLLVTTMDSLGLLDDSISTDFTRIPASISTPSRDISSPLSTPSIEIAPSAVEELDVIPPVIEELVPIPRWLWQRILEQQRPLGRKDTLLLKQRQRMSVKDLQRMSAIITHPSSSTSKSGRGCVGGFCRQPTNASHKGLTNRRVR